MKSFPLSPAAVLCAAIPLSSTAALDLALLPSTAPPSPWENVSVGTEAGLEGTAGVARFMGPESGWYNPAALAGLQEASFNVSANVYRLARITNSSGDSKASDTDFLQLPTYTASAGRFRGIGYAVGLATPESWDQRVDHVENGITLRGPYFGTVDAQSQVTSLAPFVAAGWQVTDNLQLGLSVQGYYSSISFLSSAIDRSLSFETGELVTEGVMDSISMDHWQIRTHLALRYEQGGWSFGMGMVTPGVAVWQDGKIHYQRYTSTPTFTRDAFLLQEEVTSNRDLPWRFESGLAYNWEWGEAEVVVRYYSRVKAYDMFEITNPGVVLTGDATGSRNVTLLPLSMQSTEFSEVFSLGAGGRFFVDDTHALTWGYRLNPSPIEENGKLIQDVNLHTLSMGLLRGGDQVRLHLGALVTFGRTENTRQFDAITNSYVTGTYSYFSLGGVLGTSIVY